MHTKIAGASALASGPAPRATKVALLPVVLTTQERYFTGVGENAESSHARLRQMVSEKAATQEQLDSALAARDAALGDVRQTLALIAQKTIRAPFAGLA
ncbi:hypothetical protein [Janthinobacterium sp. HLX7-2]|uniref:hypothetical protein n=1 Tax=Janthinobacterium sp. HLX7-2 TaxID=1259331 RepID=UPI003F229B53